MLNDENKEIYSGRGRPPRGSLRLKQERYTVTMPHETAELIKRLGHGNLSAGIRRLAAAVRKDVDHS